MMSISTTKVDRFRSQKDLIVLVHDDMLQSKSVNLSLSEFDSSGSGPPGFFSNAQQLCNILSDLNITRIMILKLDSEWLSSMLDALERAHNLPPYRVIC